MLIIPNGATDVTTYFVLRDSVNHAPKADVTVTDIDLYYVEQGAAMSAKADCTALAAADSAHADNKAFHVGQGLYRIDWPDAAFDGGVGKKVQLVVVCADVDTTFDEVLLSPTLADTADGVTLGSIMECLLSFMLGKAVVTDNGATRTFEFYKQDDSTVKYNCTGAEADGARSAGGNIDP